MSATAALEQAMMQSQTPKSGPCQPMISTKRSRSSMGSFDLSEFEAASKQIEDSIAFPSIEWSFSDDEDDVFSFERPSKRSCSGLVRSKSSADLSSLRCGSSGSLY
eukprot:CAMPEP_0113639736 /NCGR_PEP_ID=MMETSP0017_2-20120614/20852_1 /TAXON_ID=2856 /ORGANISM="Cylindrotheca closterium" /LENGTH=105 /DNA_ID=CAMNT_0000550977 /DNA_START=113 /DNA_END=430 /DNA_ORIENTATION=+ /assembly_acc=CAM_ASM_000147